MLSSGGKGPHAQPERDRKRSTGAACYTNGAVGSLLAMCHVQVMAAAADIQPEINYESQPATVLHKACQGRCSMHLADACWGRLG